MKPTYEELRKALEDCLCELQSLSTANDSDYARPDDDLILEVAHLLARQ